ncbi:MAG: thioredoxin family protein [Proteobacteria bacterium]|nr:thioredoxin family protein [Pseudomonadota bacterium]
MLTRRSMLAGLAATSTVFTYFMLSGSATAAAFDAAAFAAAQAAGKPILIEVHAPWCSVCKAQEPILTRLRGRPEFKNYVMFKIDYDSQKDLLRRFKVSTQSTLIAFKGRAEAGRSVGDTNPASIEALLRKAI